ncbi:hypothetical protein K7432_013629 [Basidiobolus ranarum]
MVFKGQYDETLGTELIFCPPEQQKTNINARNQSTESESKEVKFFCHTTKKITLSKVNLQPKLTKNPPNEENGAPTTTPVMMEQD